MIHFEDWSFKLCFPVLSFVQLSYLSVSSRLFVRLFGEVFMGWPFPWLCSPALVLWCIYQFSWSCTTIKESQAQVLGAGCHVFPRAVHFFWAPTACDHTPSTNVRRFWGSSAVSHISCQSKFCHLLSWALSEGMCQCNACVTACVMCCSRFCCMISVVLGDDGGSVLPAEEERKHQFKGRNWPIAVADRFHGCIDSSVSTQQVPVLDGGEYVCSWTDLFPERDTELFGMSFSKWKKWFALSPLSLECHLFKHDLRTPQGNLRCTFWLQGHVWLIAPAQRVRRCEGQSAMIPFLRCTFDIIWHCHQQRRLLWGSQTWTQASMVLLCSVALSIPGKIKLKVSKW